MPLGSQAWLYAWDFARDSGRFLQLDRETLRRSSFLDQRIGADTTHYREVPIAQLLHEPLPNALDGNPPVFIFHTAFCCSTLLARSLDLPGRSLSLREPAALLQLADLRRGWIETARKESGLLSLTLKLLARFREGDERLIVKPTNVVNNIAPTLLKHIPGTRAILLHDDLEAFLIAVLKRPRESARGLTLFLERLLADPSGRQWTRTHPVPEALAERAVLVWALQIRALESWLTQDSTADVRTLSAGQLLTSPATVLEACARWSGIPLTAVEADEIASGPAWSHHAKHPGTTYTPADRSADQARARRLFAEPVHKGFAWADKLGVAKHADFPPALRLLA
ncbi:MAG: hypothetical protein L0I62_09430 [Gammaproteobacteria bacterium]|nr:hypothetical protein [Gammaproteobacteria bacterium]